jgi:hypothetical protein
MSNLIQKIFISKLTTPTFSLKKEEAILRKNYINTAQAFQHHSHLNHEIGAFQTHFDYNILEHQESLHFYVNHSLVYRSR